MSNKQSWNLRQVSTHFCILVTAGVLVCCLSCSSEKAREQTPKEVEHIAGDADAAAITPDANDEAQQSGSVSLSDDRNTDSAGISPDEYGIDFGSSSRKTVPDSADVPAAIEGPAIITTSTSRAFAAELEKDIDPGKGGWDTEVFAKKASSELKHVGEFLVEVASGSSVSKTDFLGEDFSCSQLRPKSLTKTYNDATILVQAVRDASQDIAFEGKEGFTTAAEEMLVKLKGATELRFKFKLFRVERTNDRVKTTVFFELSGITPSGTAQINATWHCHWARTNTDIPPKILWIGVVDYEEVDVRHAEHKLFTDYTESVFQDISAYQQQLRHGIDWWRSRLENFMRVYWDGQHGVAVADVNGDGLDDVYFCEPGGMPNRLLVQRPDGTLKDVSFQSGIDFLDYTRSALFLDLDNDFDQDVIIPSRGQVSIFSNNGNGRFTLRANYSVDETTAYSLAGADYDEDGDVDFYVCFYRGIGEDESERLPAPLPYHDARTGGRNHLFRNDGNWKFQDVTTEVGLDDNNDRWSYSAVWEDLDNDGDIDLYVANDFGRNNLYRNVNGHFNDDAGHAGAEDINFGMSASVGDYDRDGLMDLYISNMFSAAGGRVTFQPQFKPDESNELKAAYRQMARGNTLLRNRGDGTYADVSEMARVTTGRWAWTSLFADLNNDGWEDLIVANGFVTGKQPDDL